MSDVIWMIEVSTKTYVGRHRDGGQIDTWNIDSRSDAEELADELEGRYSGGAIGTGIAVTQATHVVEELVIDEEGEQVWLPVDEASWGTIDSGDPVVGYFSASTGWCKHRLERLGAEKPNLVLRLRYLKDDDTQGYFIDGRFIDLEYDYRAEITRLYLAYKNRDLAAVKAIIERCYDPGLFALMQQNEGSNEG